MKIREATRKDAEALRAYAARLFAEDLPGIFRREVPSLDEERIYISSHIDRPNSTLLLAVEGSEIVGMASFDGRTLAEEAHAGEFGLSVASAWRGRGVGTALIDALVAWAREHGVTRIEAYTWATNPGATALYRRCGFVDEGVMRSAIVRDGEPVDVIMMARLL